MSLKWILHTIVAFIGGTSVGIGIFLTIAPLMPNKFSWVSNLDEWVVYLCIGIVVIMTASAYLIEQYISEETPQDDQNQNVLGGGFEISRLPQNDTEVADFIGREEEVKKLENLLLKGAEASWFSFLRRKKRRNDGFVAVITGIGGVGKTKLARKVASSEDIHEKYTGGCYLIEMSGLESNQNQTTAEAILNIIRKIAPNVNLPDDTSEETLVMNYNGVLEKSPRLILLDNPGEKIELEKFRPPRNCGLLIITRPHHKNIGFPRNVRVRLDQLTLDESKELLKNRSGLSDMSEIIAERICQLCECLPLAVRAAGTYLANEETSAEEYACELENEHNKEFGQHSSFFDKIGQKGVNQDIPTTFKLSYQLLNTNETECLFRHLGIFPSSFTAEATSAIMQKIIPSSQVNYWTEQLKLLKRYGLIEEKSSRYYLFDLLRLYARKLFEDKNENIQLALESFADYYIATAQKASEVFDDGYFCNELPNLWATFNWLVGSDPDHPRDMDRVKQLVEASIKIIESNKVENDEDENELQKLDFYFSQSEYEEWLKVGLATLRPAYDQLDNLQKKVFAKLCVFKDDWFDLKAAKIVTECNNEQTFNILVQRGLLYQRNSDQWCSLTNLSYILALKQIGTEYNTVFLRYVDYFITVAEEIESLHTSRMDESIKILKANYAHIRTVLNWSLKNRDAHRLEKLLLAIRYYKFYEFQYKELKEWFTEWIFCATESYKALAQYQFGEICLHVGEYPMAEKYFQKALSLAKGNNDKVGQSDALFGLGRSKYFVGDYSNAKIYLNEALTINSNHLPSLVSLADIYLKENKFIKAKRIYEEQLQRADNGPYNQAVLYENLAILNESQGNLDEALSMARKSLAIVEQYDIFILKKTREDHIKQLKQKKQGT